MLRARLFVPYPDPWDTILSVAISHDPLIHVIRRCQHTLDQGALVTQSDVERTGTKKAVLAMRAIGQIVTPLGSYRDGHYLFIMGRDKLNERHR
jgi:hypothetical protein